MPFLAPPPLPLSSPGDIGLMHSLLSLLGVLLIKLMPPSTAGASTTAFASAAASDATAAPAAPTGSGSPASVPSPALAAEIPVVPTAAGEAAPEIAMPAGDSAGGDIGSGGIMDGDEGEGLQFGPPPLPSPLGTLLR